MKKLLPYDDVDTIDRFDLETVTKSVSFPEVGLEQECVQLWYHVWQFQHD